MSKLVALAAGLVIFAALPTGAWAAEWHVQKTPNNGTEANSLDGVSCGSSTMCIAVGSSTKWPHVVPLAEYWNGKEWSLEEPPAPAESTESHLFHVSCSSTGRCTAVGSARYASSPGERPLIENWELIGRHWSIQETPKLEGEGYLYSVSCTAWNECTAAGGIQGRPLVERLNGTEWKVQTAASSEGFVLGVSCSSFEACVAVGDSALPFAEGWSGGVWSTEALAAAEKEHPFLSSVSCTALTSCISVGRQGSSTEELGKNSPLVERKRATGWSTQKTPTLPHGGILRDVSCVSSTTCTAVGLHGTAGWPVFETLAETWNGGEWAVNETPNPGGNDELAGISCFGSVCTAVGNYEPTVGTKATLAERYE
jgi:hypothetical protein